MNSMDCLVRLTVFIDARVVVVVVVVVLLLLLFVCQLQLFVLPIIKCPKMN